MKLTVTQENLSKALNTVSRIASSRGSLPILSNILLKTFKNQLVITATNLDVAITEKIGAKITQEGSTTVPARLMQDFVGSLPSGNLEIITENDKLSITSDRFQSTINGMSSEDFPAMPNIEGGTTIDVSSEDLKKALDQVLFTASSDNSRPVLTGVLLHSHKGNIYLAATDSYRLGQKATSVKSEDLKLLIPATSLQEVLRSLKGPETVAITFDDQQVIFSLDNVEIITRLVEGKYPEYTNLIPKNFETTAKIKRQDLIEITKVSSLFAREAAGSVTLVIDEAKQEISINSIASQVGENTAVASSTVSGDATITMNSRYILDALQAFEGDEIQININGKVDPCVFSDPADETYMHLIMPVKS